jgi:Tfp pilus assembly protein PilE
MTIFTPSKRATSRGFTLVEMMIIAPIVILAIGAFITLIVNLTGEIMSSRGSNTVTYNVQNALNRIEEDVKLSAGFLQTNSIKFNATTNPQGRGNANSVTDFTAAGDSTTGPALILNSLVTDGNPLSLDSRLIYLANQPNDCSNAAEYIKNRPMTMNIIYFIKDNTLWRRTVMPTGYDVGSNYCGSKAPWQRPSCVTATSHAFCKTNDERLVDNVAASGFNINYFNSASSSTPISPTSNTVLQPATTAAISITSNSVVAGREIIGAGTVKASRLDTNASALGEIAVPTSAPATPNVSYKVSDGHRVVYTWPRVASATRYTIQYKAGNGTWSAAETLDNNSRLFEVTDGWNGDEVSVRVAAHNVVGSSPVNELSMRIPVWAPLVLKGNWTDYGSTYGTAAYTRTPTGLVMFRGLIKNSAFVAGQQVVATIPQDYAPDGGNLIFPALYGGNASGRVDVNAPDPDTGESDVLMVIGDGGWVSLENIRYSKPSTRDSSLPSFSRTSPSFLNGWVNYTAQPPTGPGYAPATYAQDPTSLRVYTQGLIRSGTNTDGANMFMLPAALQPAQYQHIATRSVSDSGVGVHDSVEAKNTGSNGYQSVNTITYPSGAITWTNAPLVNGWVNYGGIFATAGYSMSTSDTMNNDGVGTIQGLVSLKGLIRAGSTTYDSTIFTLPAQYRPKYRILFSTLQHNGSTGTMALARIDILPTGEVRFMGNTNLWYSLDGITFLADG